MHDKFYARTRTNTIIFFVLSVLYSDHVIDGMIWDYTV